jgi:AcrR family transcriptional regulator
VDVAKASREVKPRKIPAQKRSVERRERILVAAAELFAEVGFEAATMEVVAQRAQSSIGSVYQFYPNKAAVFNAINLRYLEKVALLFEELVPQADVTVGWESLLDQVIDMFYEFHLSDPMFRAIWLSSMVSTELVQADEELARKLAGKIEILTAFLAPHLEAKQRLLVSVMIVEAVGSMLLVATRRRPDLGGLVMQETKVMLKRYLTPYFQNTP